ncbi:BnaCnng53310D [Brassica napus]|uniref:(rape) hypothetical protein n=1 Tax=Brassica napus TaxID=3708 RepID=A0A078JKS7_BRANA|nr:unnamed protein product [Brassica napus]CDY67045.1 BnaCnng53310D [Brassica napus]
MTKPYTNSNLATPKKPKEESGKWYQRFINGTVKNSAKQDFLRSSLSSQSQKKRLADA